MTSEEPASPPEATASGTPVPHRRRGLIVLGAAFIALAVGLGGARAAGVGGGTPSAPAPSASYQADPPVPSAARTSVYASGQEPSGVYQASTLGLAPTHQGAKINPFTVTVETSLRTDPDAVARLIFATLDDNRGWASYGKNAFQLTAQDAPGQLKFVLASPKTVDALCGASETKGTWDCRTGDTIVLNSDRWFYGTPTFSSLPDYRAYQVNRQVGFWLGQQKGVCRFKRAYAPVMADQNENLRGCLANPWPRLAGEKPPKTPRPSSTPSPTAGG